MYSWKHLSANLSQRKKPPAYKCDLVSLPTVALVSLCEIHYVMQGFPKQLLELTFFFFLLFLSLSFICISHLCIFFLFFFSLPLSSLSICFSLSLRFILFLHYFMKHSRAALEIDTAISALTYEHNMPRTLVEKPELNQSWMCGGH